MNQLNHVQEGFSELLKDLMPRAKFAHKYGIMYYKLKDAIEKGLIATICIDGKVYINVTEALSVLRPSAIEKKVDDLFA